MTYEYRGWDPAKELEIVRALCHAFASTIELEEAASSTVRWVRAAMGDSVTVRVLVNDRDTDSGLTVAEEQGFLAPNRAAESTATDSKKPVRYREEGSQDEVLILPLVSRGECLGLIEVAASAAALDERASALHAVASQAAIALRNMRDRAVQVRDTEASRQNDKFGRALLGASTPEGVVRTAVGFFFETLGTPAAGWLSRWDRGRLDLVAVKGFGSEKRDELRKALRTIPRMENTLPGSSEGLARLFVAAVGIRDAEVIDAGDALLMVGRPLPHARAQLETLSYVLRDVLNHLAAVTQAHRRNEQLDLGVAWTAHELRRPLFGARATLDRLLSGSHDPATTRTLLELSKAEMEDMITLVDGVLRWAIGNEPLRKRATDLSKLIRSVARRLDEREQERIAIGNLDKIAVAADPLQLRSALTNVFHNSLSYSPPDSKVKVTTEVENGSARILISDRGAGIPERDRELIFDPLVRGTNGKETRQGKGLGLFIARRIVEAHGGAIWVKSNGKGATFCIELPSKKAAKIP